MSHLEELARQVRGTTLDFLHNVPAEWLLWAPPGTSNHILWHAGHALWAQDVLCVEPLTGASELPAGWADKFGMNCRPVAKTVNWPDRAELWRLLSTQLDRLVDLFAEHEDRLTHIGPNAEAGQNLTRGIIHGLHDEARHQGEMYLLMKLRRYEAQTI